MARRLHLLALPLQLLVVSIDCARRAAEKWFGYARRLLSAQEVLGGTDLRDLSCRGAGLCTPRRIGSAFTAHEMLGVVNIQYGSVHNWHTATYT